MIGPMEIARGTDNTQVMSNPLLHEAVKGWKGEYKLTRFEFAKPVRADAEAQLRDGVDISEVAKKFGGFVKEETIGKNLLLNEGINALLTLLAGGAETAYSNANARIGVGDSATAASASQTDLQAASNKTYKAMDATYPTYGTSQQIVFRSTFGSSDANYAWAEFVVDNGNSAGKTLNRLVSSQGTKASGQTWVVTLTITLA